VPKQKKEKKEKPTREINPKNKRQETKHKPSRAGLALRLFAAAALARFPPQPPPFRLPFLPKKPFFPTN
jgi:hypothetical protein